jgi:hypothetical protein
MVARTELPALARHAHFLFELAHHALERRVNRLDLRDAARAPSPPLGECRLRRRLARRGSQAAAVVAEELALVLELVPL